MAEMPTLTLWVSAEKTFPPELRRKTKVKDKTRTIILFTRFDLILILLSLLFSREAESIHPACQQTDGMEAIPPYRMARAR
jgi:hypothetical protein